uniref:Uncharacterized protein n=1 Tax=Caenorhabditis japonica TaxID=281687 RepID=A0A8R1HPG6_CAEJA
MEFSQHDVVEDENHDFSMVRKHNSELDVCLDDAKRCEGNNEQDILSSLMTAIDTSMSHASVRTAMTFETTSGAINLNADADPPLATQLSMSTASELNDKNDIDDYYFDLENPPGNLEVFENDTGEVIGFEMLMDGEKVHVVDSMECIAHMESAQLEPVFFDPRIYLGVPAREEEEVEASAGQFAETVLSECVGSDDILTGELGPSFNEFSQYLGGLG